ncbi:gustatory receptor 10a [Stomoxys calcitrans]|uniref:gustatory receptor 10a n=1 Tax=Stomoxys calcitrans TaxID=35570 RepID=UPI0027E35497|nr:gustatory receptor 10a [Stomoxys calcitrans]
MSIKLSFWEKHKVNIYIFGNIYATINGLMVINYIPTTSTKSLRYYLATIYCHVLSFAIIILLPLYFFWNLQYLVETKDRRWKIQLLVNFSNTFIKYCMVVVTYIANFVHYKDIRYVTKRRQSLEEEFNRICQGLSEEPRTKFEFMLLFKFGLINAMMMVQIAQISYQYFMGSNAVRVYFQLYTFFLWNYTENMADYFYFINCSALKFLHQLKQRIQKSYEKNRRYVRYRRHYRRTGLVGHLCCVLSDHLDSLNQRYGQICKLYKDSVLMHQFQILGLILTTLISNLTNFFTLFSLLSKHKSYRFTDIALNCIFATVFYIDTYIVTLISDRIYMEMDAIRLMVQKFSELPRLDWRLEETIENMSFSLLTYDGRFRICGLFYLDRHLTFLTASAGLAYFITLVQFDINWNNFK